MLPSNPRSARSAARGMTYDPSLRSYSASLGAQDDYAYDNRGDNGRAPPQLRSQRSIANVVPGRSSDARGMAPPMPRPSRPSTAASQSQTSYSQPRGSLDASSPSSTGSSFLDRMKVYSSSSSRTSLEDEQEMPRRGKAWPPVKEKRTVEEDNGQDDYEDEAEEGKPPAGYGSSIWNRIASATGSLTVNVNMAWASKIVTQAGEETPPGQESRLTRAMKAYHLEKARDPSDLPSWLFEEYERMPPRTQRRQEDPREREMDDAPTQPPRRGLRDIYAAAAVSSNPPMKQAQDRTPRYDRDREAEGRPSKATDKLKAIRDAKRNAATRLDEPSYAREERFDRQAETGRPSMDNDGNGARPAPAPRMGLPSRPARPRARQT